MCVCVCRYYSDIHSAASGCYQEMNSTLTELSGVSEHTHQSVQNSNIYFSVKKLLSARFTFLAVKLLAPHQPHS